MQVSWLLFVSLLFVCGSFAQECSSSPLQNPNATPAPVPDKILFINILGLSYEANMQRGKDILEQNVFPGSTVEYHVLSSSNPLVKTEQEMDEYTQIWVSDLESRYGGWPAQSQSAAALVAGWWNRKGQPDMILDGRWISSLIWGGRPDNQQLVINYYENLRKRGGGIVLATDHNAFHLGINSFNAALGINPFFGNNAGPVMKIDITNPVASEPANMCVQSALSTAIALGQAPAGATCASDPFIWDDSSTGNTPFGTQPNGVELYPLGYHSSDANDPGISSTIRGTVGFLVEIVQPQCLEEFEVGEAFVARGILNGTFSGIPPYRYTWTVNGTVVEQTGLKPDTFDDTVLVFTTPGIRVIRLSVEDSQNLVASAVVTINVVIPPCPKFEYFPEGFCQDASLVVDGEEYDVRKDFNVIAFNDFVAKTGDTQGRMLVGNNLQLLEAYSVADQLGEAEKNYSLIVLNDAYWHNGRLYFEEMYVGENYQVGPDGNFSVLPVRTGGGPCQNQDCQDAKDALAARVQQLQQCYTQKSDAFFGIAQNVDYELKYEGIFVNCTPGEMRYVLNLDASTFSSIKWYSLTDCNTEAEWLINIDGSGSSEVKFQGDYLPAPNGRVTYNIKSDGCNGVVTVETDVNGNILAPQANIFQRGGVVRGKVIACNYNASTDASQINLQCDEDFVPIFQGAVDDDDSSKKRQAGSSSFTSVAGSNVQVGDLLLLSPGTVNEEQVEVTNIEGDTFELLLPMQNSHPAGQRFSFNIFTPRYAIPSNLIPPSPEQQGTNPPTSTPQPTSPSLETKEPNKESGASQMMVSFWMMLACFFFFF